MKIGIIGGSGFDDFPELGEGRPRKVETPFGTVGVSEFQFEDRIVYFLPRHGEGHSVAPHLINCKANITALKQLDVHSIFATAAVGAISELYEVGDLALLVQFLDFTKQRPLSLLDQSERPIHLDMTIPYCPRLTSELHRVADEVDVKLNRDAIYACTEGPRFETAAEVQALRRLGADLVGMTQVPEVVFARESEMCYATVAMVTNLAAGRMPGQTLSQENIKRVTSSCKERVVKLLSAAVRAEEDIICECQYALYEYK